MKLFIVGNLVRDPALKFANSGTAICEFTIADNYRKNKESEEEVSYIDVTLFGDLAKNFADSCNAGQRVFAEGRLRQENWEDKDTGAKRSKVKLIADNAGPDLRFHTAVITKVERGDPNVNRSRGGNASSNDRQYDNNDFF